LSGCDAPGREFRPAAESLGRPGVRLVLVAARARVRYLHGFGHRRRDEPERVAAHHDVADGLLDRRHVAADAFVARRPGAVMRVLLDARRVRAVRRLWTVARQAHLGGGPYEIRIVPSPMDVMAAGARDAVRVHHALR